MKVLVTGAAGFIGSNLADKLARRGDTVVGLDNFNDYYDPARKRANEARLNAHPNFRMIEADIRDRQRMLEIFEEERFDDYRIMYRLIHASRMPVRNDEGHACLFEAFHQDALDSG